MTTHNRHRADFHLHHGGVVGLGTTYFRAPTFDESLKGAGDVDLGRAARKAAQGDDYQGSREEGGATGER